MDALSTAGQQATQTNNSLQEVGDFLAGKTNPQPFTIVFDNQQLMIIAVVLLLLMVMAIFIARKI